MADYVGVVEGGDVLAAVFREVGGFVAGDDFARGVEFCEVVAEEEGAEGCCEEEEEEVGCYATC